MLNLRESFPARVLLPESVAAPSFSCHFSYLPPQAISYSTTHRSAASGAPTTTMAGSPASPRAPCSCSSKKPGPPTRPRHQHLFQVPPKWREKPPMTKANIIYVEKKTRPKEGPTTTKQTHRIFLLSVFSITICGPRIFTCVPTQLRNSLFIYLKMILFVRK